MSNGIITRYDEAGYEHTIETPGLDQQLRKMGIYRRTNLKDDIFSILQGSGNRSQFFMYYNCRKYSSAQNNIFDDNDYWIPMCGVKQQPPKQQRSANMTEFLIFEKDKLNGNGFNDTVFGTNYVTGEDSENRTEQELLDIISNNPSSISGEIRDSKSDIVCRVFNALWDVQRLNPSARLVIVMDNPETDSMELLRQVYLLMPSELRLNIGFMTNVSSYDMQKIAEGMPIYVTTASPSAWDEIKKYKYSIPIFPFDLNEIQAYNFKDDTISKLKEMAKHLDADTLDSVEKQVLKNNELSYSSFEYYEEILNSYTATIELQSKKQEPKNDFITEEEPQSKQETDNGLITEAEPQNEEQEPNDHVITEVTRQIRALYYGYRDNGLDFKTLENIIDKLKKEVENPQK